MDIAVIGMACRLPEASHVGAFWENLREGVESIRFFSDQELLAAGVDPNWLSDPRFVKAGAVLDGIELFDAGFFGYSPREAASIDPQHRLFLECAWEALEHAGCRPNNANIGVFAGAGMNWYLHDLIRSHRLESLTGFQVMVAGDKDFLPTRVSYKLGLTGPSLNIQTACSTSLVAVHCACQALAGGECEAALAGGVAVNPWVGNGYFFQEGMIFSPDGHCRPFDAQARGTLSANGVAAVVLKRLDRALEDGDQIYAVVKASALNNDGAAKMGYTAPSIEGQADVIVKALEKAGLGAGDISYVEAHGTGTELGDPVEMAALTRAFRHTSEGRGYCGLGSVKSNLGHLDTAAGVVGFLKVVLALHHRQLPPTLHYQRPNPGIDFESSPFYVVDRLTDWGGSAPLRAGVSSFGIGGTNAHAILEQAPEAAVSAPARPVELLLLSARTPTALEKMAANLAARLREEPLNLADVSFTLSCGRATLPHRRTLSCLSLEDAIKKLEHPAARVVRTSHQETRSFPLVFLFPGQGAQYPGMAAGLYHSEPKFRETLDGCCQVLAGELDHDLRRLLIDPRAEAEVIRQTRYAQPALFVVEYSLAQLLIGWGLRPEATFGHSVGEYVAACLSGVFSMEQALRLVATRGRLMQEQQPGSMLAVQLEAEKLAGRLQGDLCVAAYNAPTLCVVAGPSESVKALQEALEREGVGTRPLVTSHAFHSSLMDPMLERFTEEVARLAPSAAEHPYISGLSGDWIDPGEAASPDYWARQIRQPVRFGDGLSRLLENPDRVFLEVGPGRTMSTLLRLQPGSTGRLALTTLPGPEAGSGATSGSTAGSTEALADALGRLWLLGYPLDWEAYHRGRSRRKVALPTYPFEHRRFWSEQFDSIISRASDDYRKRPDPASWFYVPSWKRLPPPIPEEAKSERWLILADSGGRGAELSLQLREQGHEVILVVPGREYGRRGPDEYRIQALNGAHYQDLIRELRSCEQVPTRVVHCCGLVAEGDNLSFQQAQDQALMTLIFLVQALGGQHVQSPLELTVISNDLFEVYGDPVRHPERSGAMVLARVVTQEYSNIRARFLDLDAGVTARELAAELLCQAPAYLLALRGGRRWARAYESLPFPSQGSSVLRRGGVYLITGGLSGIGLELARFLADQFEARLVLCSRRAVERGTELHAQLESWRSRGLEIEAASVDVGRADQLQALMAVVQERFGALHGVIHAAGVAAGGAVQFLTPADVAEGLRPKVEGTRLLLKAVEEAAFQPDFVALWSSMSVPIGGSGLGVYAAANAYLDSLVESSGASNLWSINWDVWSEVGMVVDTEVPLAFEERRRRMLDNGLTTAEGLDAFVRILGSPCRRVVVSTRDLPAMLAEYDYGVTRGAAQEWEASEYVPGLPEEITSRPPLVGPYLAPTTETETRVAAIWEKLLGVEPVGVDDDFFELGGHSLLATQVIARLHDAFGVELSMRSFFEARTVGQMADLVETVLWAARGPVETEPGREEFTF